MKTSLHCTRTLPTGVLVIALAVFASLGATRIVDAESPRIRPDFTEVKLIQDLAYLGPDRKEKLDLYLPTDQRGPKRPGIVIIHGGGWRGGDKFQPREQITGTTLVRAGYVCVSINYALADPNHCTWPENIHDCKMAVQFLRKNAQQYHIDANNIGVIGGSAGGHLAAMLGVTGDLAELNPDAPCYEGISTKVQAVVDMYGIADLTTWPAQNACQQYLGHTLEQAPALYRKASPISHVSSDDPPFLILHGTKDTTVELEQSQVLAAELKRKKVPADLFILENGPHSFHLQPPQQDLRPMVIRFFDTHLKPASATVSDHKANCASDEQDQQHP